MRINDDKLDHRLAHRFIKCPHISGHIDTADVSPFAEESVVIQQGVEGILKKEFQSCLEGILDVLREFFIVLAEILMKESSHNASRYPIASS